MKCFGLGVFFIQTIIIPQHKVINACMSGYDQVCMYV